MRQQGTCGSEECKNKKETRPFIPFIHSWMKGLVVVGWGAEFSSKGVGGTEGGGAVGGHPPPPGGSELLEAPKAPNQFFGLN